MQAARKKYGKKTRNGGIVPHTRNVLNDFNYFLLERTVNNKMQNMYFEDSYDDYMHYQNAMADACEEEPPAFESYEEEKVAEREYLDSLEV
jgi:hypothetical protein